MANALPGSRAGTGPAGSTRPPAGEVRVLVVDDSLMARSVYARLIGAEPDMVLAGQCSSAEQALALLRETSADVIILDLEMPGMGGLHALPRMMALVPQAKVLVVSALTVEGGEHTVAALSLGAADTLPKPVAGQFDAAYRQALVAAIRALAPRGGRRRAAAAPAQATRRAQPQPRGKLSGKPPRVLAIGASTGGILALRQFFEKLPDRIGIPILVTQHLPQSFLPAFAEHVARFARRPASLASPGAVLRADEIMIAPGFAHLLVDNGKDGLVARLETARSDSGCLPSLDPMFASLAQATQGHCLALVLTGMGRDGTAGARAVAEAGGTVMVQDEPSSAVWGMPGSVAHAGLASAILPPEGLAARVPVGKAVA